MKKGIFILVILILASFALAQEDIRLIPSEEKLDVNYHAFGGQYTIDLKKYMGDGPYLVSKTKNVVVDINQDTGRAIITPNLGFEGSEIITFAINKTRAIITLPRETFREIEIGKVVIFQDIFDDVINNIKKENIRKIESGFRDKKLFIIVNDEVNLFAGYDKDQKPEFTFDILIANEAKEERQSLFDNVNISIIIIAFIISILLFIFRDRVINILIIKENKEKIKRKFLSRLIKYRENDEEILNLMESFFETFLKIKKNSGLYALDLALERREIEGDLKQEIIDLFKHLNDDEQGKRNMKHIYNSLRRVLIKI